MTNIEEVLNDARPIETHRGIKTLIGADYNPKQFEAVLALLYEVQRQMRPPLW
ncbi:hypothetical protein [Aeromonas hydrophila]|uniref:hypothetical protein n=1 Tax=Aeromonas hydrophila TaxID=644 RepID=UPI002B4672F7|nr:hypothetical protein [Aeromonas hydrophila]